MNWNINPVNTVRVAALPAERLGALSLHRCGELLDAIERTTQGIEPLREQCIDALHHAVSNAPDDQARRVALNLKRRVFNNKPLGSQGDAIAAMDSAVRNPLQALLEAESKISQLREQFNEVFESDWQAAILALKPILAEPRCQDALYQTSHEQFELAERFIEHQGPYTKRETIRGATLGRYVFRASTRTTPLGSYSGVAVQVAGQKPAVEQWLTVAKLNLQYLEKALARSLDTSWLMHTNIHLNPLHRVTEGKVIFSRYDRNAANGLQMGELAIDEPLSQLKPALDDHQKLSEVVEHLAQTPAQTAQWREYIERLVRGGLLQVETPRDNTDPAGLQRLAERMEQLQQPDTAAMLRQGSSLLTQWAEAKPAERAELAKPFAKYLQQHSGQQCHPGRLDVANQPAFAAASRTTASHFAPSPSPGSQLRSPRGTSTVVQDLHQCLWCRWSLQKRSGLLAGIDGQPGIDGPHPHHPIATALASRTQPVSGHLL